MYRQHCQSPEWLTYQLLTRGSAHAHSRMRSALPCAERWVLVACDLLAHVSELTPTQELPRKSQTRARRQGALARARERACAAHGQAGRRVRARKSHQRGAVVPFPRREDGTPGGEHPGRHILLSKFIAQRFQLQFLAEKPTENMRMGGGRAARGVGGSA